VWRCHRPAGLMQGLGLGLGLVVSVIVWWCHRPAGLMQGLGLGLGLVVSVIVWWCHRPAGLMQQAVCPKMATDMDSHTPQQCFRCGSLNAAFPYWITILCRKQTTFSVEIQQYWKLVTVVKWSVIGPWEFHGRGLPVAPSWGRMVLMLLISMEKAISRASR